MGYTLCVLGCGTMGIAILSGVLSSLESSTTTHSAPKWESHTPGTMTPVGPPDSSTPTRFIACVTRQESETKLVKLFGAAVNIVVGNNARAVSSADVILLCCKPQQAQCIVSGIKDALSSKLLVSILAGVTISQMRQWVHPSTHVIRAMPNTPCKIREGMTVIGDSETADEHRSIVVRIFSSIGRCMFLEEKHFDACTALSGSGPAFACIFLEAMVDGGVMMGLPRAKALELAAQTLQGAARMTLQPGTHPAQIKDTVTTPGGCTIAGLLALEDGKVRSTIARAIQIATERASELGQPKK